MFKILVTVSRDVQGTAPVYLGSMFKRVHGNYRLRSSNEIRFIVPRTRTRVADRSITTDGPKWWNALPNDIKTCTNETSFRNKLKTHLLQNFITDNVNLINSMHCVKRNRLFSFIFALYKCILYCARHEKWQRFTVRKEESTFQNRRPVFLAKLIPVKCRIPKGIGKLLIILDSSFRSAHF